MTIMIIDCLCCNFQCIKGTFVRELRMQHEGLFSWKSNENDSRETLTKFLLTLCMHPSVKGVNKFWLTNGRMRGISAWSLAWKSRRDAIISNGWWVLSMRGSPMKTSVSHSLENGNAKLRGFEWFSANIHEWFLKEFSSYSARYN